MPSVPPKRTLPDVLLRAVRLGLADAHVSIPARVVRVDLAANLVDAQPLIMDVVDDGRGGRRAVAFPVVTNVPIFSPSGGGFRMTFPVAVDDVVTVMFSDRSVDIWLARGGGPVDPVDPRAHALSDGVVAIPSINPAAPWTIRADAATIGHEAGPLLVLKANEIRLDDGGALVARKGDRAKAGNTMAAWITKVQACLAGSGPAARDPTLLAPTDFGVIDEGAARVKA
jgi:hypothetical protein